MKLKNHFAIALVAASITAACGGSDGGTGDLQLAQTADAVETKYSTGCVSVNHNPGWQKVDITISRVPFETKGIASVDFGEYSDSACTNLGSRVYLKGPADWSGGPKTLTRGAATKVGAKGVFAPDSMTLFGVSLNFVPTSQKLNFVVVDEGDLLYFGTGFRDTDGYPPEISKYSAHKL